MLKFVCDWGFNSIGVLVVCVLELFCVLCVVVYYNYMYVLFMRILGLVFYVYSGMFQGFFVFCFKFYISVLCVLMF